MCVFEAFLEGFFYCSHITNPYLETDLMNLNIGGEFNFCAFRLRDKNGHTILLQRAVGFDRRTDHIVSSEGNGDQGGLCGTRMSSSFLVGTTSQLLT